MDVAPAQGATPLPLRRGLALILLSLVLSLPVAAALFCTWAMEWRWPRIATVQLQGSDLLAQQGESLPVKGQPSARQVHSAKGLPAVLLLRFGEPVEAATFSRLVLEAGTLEGKPMPTVYLLWVPEGERTMQRQSLTEGVVDLAALPKWRGKLREFGLAFDTPADAPLIVKGLRLEPAPLTLERLLDQLQEDARLNPGWTGRAINLGSVGADTALLATPAPLLGLWLLLASSVLLWIARQRGRRERLILLLALWLPGLLLLEARTQWTFWQRHLATEQRYAGQEGVEREAVGPDAANLRLASRIKALLGASPRRIVLLGNMQDTQDRYPLLRLQYHLLPHSTLTLGGAIKGMERLRPGELLLIRGPLPKGISFDVKTGQLSVPGGHALSARPVLRDHGVLLLEIMQDTEKRP